MKPYLRNFQRFITIGILIFLGVFFILSKPDSKLTPPRPIISKNELIGSWHASPYVAAGFAQRYVFFANGNFIFFPNQNLDDKIAQYYAGTWQIENNQLQLSFNHYRDLQNKKQTINRNLTYQLGTLDPTDPNETAYTKKTKIHDQYFWQYSQDPQYWAAEFEL